MRSKFFHYIGLVASLGLIITCFLPWTSYPVIDTTFTGFSVHKFPSGTYYGRAGYPIIILTGLILLLQLIPKIGAKRICVFVSAVLLAYTVRTYIVFTSSLMEDDVIKHAGIYLILIFSVILMASSIFPYLPQESLATSEDKLEDPAEEKL